MRKRNRFAALLLASALLLSACAAGGFGKPPETVDTVREQEKTELREEITGTGPEPQQKPEEAPEEPFNPRGAAKPIVPFEQMVYERPDLNAIEAPFSELQRLLKEDADAEALLEQIALCEAQHDTFFTMDKLAQIRASLDVTDRSAAEEYSHCRSLVPTVRKLYEELCVSCAAASCVKTLEERHFGEGFAEAYSAHPGLYSDPEYVKLLEREEALLDEYRTLSANPVIEFRGETVAFRNLGGAIISADDYNEAERLYYEKYGKLLGELYLELISVRCALAARLGYDSYEQYAFSALYGRDYSPEDAGKMTEAIRKEIVPLYRGLLEDGAWGSARSEAADEAWLVKTAGAFADELGGTASEAWRFISDYALYDFSDAPNKGKLSFETYLRDYKAPYLFVKTGGSEEDLFSVLHELGQGADAYQNDGAVRPPELQEVCAQALEYLVLNSEAALPDAGQRERLTRCKLTDTVELLAQQSSIHEFERRVYAMPESERTVENLCALFLQLSKDYGYYEEGYDLFYSFRWIDLQHLFEYPFHSLSYCVSCGAAFALYGQELSDPGAGSRAYLALLPREEKEGFRTALQSKAGLEDPLSPESVRRTAALLRELLEP